MILQNKGSKNITQGRIKKYNNAKRILRKNKIDFTEFPSNNQLQCYMINYWTTSEKWYDTTTKRSGIGIKSFIKYIRGGMI